MAGSSSVKGIVALILLVVSFDSFGAVEVVLSINSKKPFAVTSERFLSITLDPAVILTGSLLTNDIEKNVNMAKALAPAFVRIAGPKSNSYIFEGPHQTEKSNADYTFTEGNWSMVNQWAENAGLDLMAAVPPQQHSGGVDGLRDNIRDSRNIIELISFSDQKGFNVSWQLGFECQARCDLDGGEMGKDVTRLRSMLEAYPRFAGNIIAGPDVLAFRTKQQQVFLQNYLDSAANALSAITWHPNFASITLDPSGVSMHIDNLASDKDALYRIIGRHMAKKPLWLAESQTEECKKQFLGALVWLRRLGNSAKLGAQVLMRQPQDSNLFEPTPDYWVSVLHKNLVGPEVLDTKISTGNRTHMHFYCQCTRPSSMYEKGSLTVFGVNLTPVKLAVTLKGLKIKTLHKYILLPGFDAENRMFSETVLLNNEPLTLLNGKDVPEIRPAVVMSEKGLAMELPSGGVGFWVIPDIKVKICEGQKNNNADKMILKRFTKHFDEFGSEGIDENVELENEQTQEIPEDRKPFIKASNKIRMKHRSDDQASNIYKKLDAELNLERLEELLKLQENFEEKRTSNLRGKAGHMRFPNSDYGINTDTETEAKIRSKLEEYKRRLSELEEQRGNPLTVAEEETNNSFLNGGKFREAMSLINKLEDTLKSFQHETSESSDPVEANPSDSLGSNAEGNFLGQIVKTKGARAATIPEKIDQQLKTIPAMLAEEEEEKRQYHQVQTFNERNRPILARRRRNADRWLGDNEPQGFVKDPVPRRRTQVKKNKKKDEKNKPVSIDSRIPQSNNEGNKFRGIVETEPIKKFPSGDVFLETETMFERRNRDYDYVQDDGDDRFSAQRQVKRSTDVEQKTPGDLRKNGKSQDEAQADSRSEKLDEGKLRGIFRAERSLKNIDSILNAEMIFEDDDNMKDCQCRVNRGIKSVKRECKNCKKIFDQSEFTTLKKSANPGMKLRDHGRMKRDIQGDEYELEDDYPESSEVLSDNSNSTRTPIVSEADQEFNFTKTIAGRIPPESSSSNRTLKMKETLEESSQNVPKIQDDISAKAPTVKQVRQAGSPKVDGKLTGRNLRIAQRESKGLRIKRKPLHKSSRKSTTTTTTTTTTEPTVTSKTRKLKFRTTTAEPTITEVTDKPTVKVSKRVNQKTTSRKSAGNEILTRARKAHQDSEPKPLPVQKKVNEPKSPSVQKKVSEPKPLPVQKKENEAKKDVKVPAPPTATTLINVSELKAEREKLIQAIREKLNSRRKEIMDLTKLKTEKSAHEKAKITKREIYQNWNNNEGREYDNIDDLIQYIPECYPEKEAIENSNNMKNSKENFGQEEFPDCDNVLTDFGNDLRSLENRNIEEINHLHLQEQKNQEVMNEEKEVMDNLERKGKKKYLYVEVDSDKLSAGDGNTPFKVVKKKDHYMAIPLEENKPKSEPDEQQLKFRNSELAFPKFGDVQPTKIQNRMNFNNFYESSKSDREENAWLSFPVKQNNRQKREIHGSLIDDSKNDIWGNTVEIKSIERKKLKNGILNWDGYLKEGKSEFPTKNKDEGVSSFMEKVIPEFHNLVTNELGKAQNLTGSFEKLINKFEAAGNENETMDEKTQFEDAVKNNPDGLWTFDFFHDSIRYVKIFFDFLNSMTWKIIG